MADSLCDEDARCACSAFLSSLFTPGVYEEWTNLKYSLNFTKEADFVQYLINSAILYQEMTQGNEMYREDTGLESSDQVGKELEGEDDVEAVDDNDLLGEDMGNNGVGDATDSLSSMLDYPSSSSSSYVMDQQKQGSLKRKRTPTKMPQLVHLQQTADSDTSSSTLWPKEQRQPAIIRKYSATYPVCQFCRKDFYDRSTLMKHIKRVHNRIKDNPCQDCDLAFSTPSQLRSHRIYKHGDSSQFQCQECNKCYPTRSALFEHTKMCMKNSLSTSQVTYTTPEDMKVEMGEFTCVDCNEHFPTQSSLSEHAIICQPTLLPQTL